MDKLYANIIVDVNVEALNKCFIYNVPDNLRDILKPGDKVVFPFGKGDTEREGYLLELLTLEQLKNKNFYKREKYFKEAHALDNLKEIKGKANKKIGASEILLKIAIFMAKEYFAPIASCINTVLPVKKEIRKNSRQTDAITKYDEKLINNKNIVLNNEQLDVVDNIVNKLGVFSEHLIYGITGSGKTEVYIKVIEETLKKNKQVIVLIPEIALTHQTVIRLKEKFSENIAIIHSKMSQGDRFIQYKKCESGETNILVGPRSVIFAPFENLGLIVIDEVNDSSYKSETTPRYDTIDVARFRAKEQNATLISLSATPNITLYTDALNNKLDLHVLHNRAVSDLPKVSIVDMIEERKKGNQTIFSNKLQDAIRDRISRHEQVILYMNRRGFDTIFTCKDCGETYKCPHCDVALVSHLDGKLKCHYCGFEIDEPRVCPSCHSTDIEKYGMGTEKLEELTSDLFPHARILRMDRDTTKEKDAHDRIIEKFRRKDADILIGTQMIVKGHDFPDVTLVGVMRADLSLYAQDYKSTENTFSMLTQCVGRSGRGKKGEAIIQTYDIDNSIFEFIQNQDFVKFYDQEMIFRNKLNYPPYCKLLYIKMASNDEYLLEETSKNLKFILNTKNDTSAIILGPTKMNPEKVKDTYYKMIIMKCKTIDECKKYRRLAANFMDYSDKDKSIKFVFDIE